MEVLIYIGAGLLVGAILAAMIAHFMHDSKLRPIQQALTESQQALSQTQTRLSESQQALSESQQALTEAKVRVAEAQKDAAAAVELNRQIRRMDEEKLEIMAQSHKTEMENLKTALEEQWNEKAKTMKAEFETLSQKHLDQQKQGLKAANDENIANLLNPLKQQIADFSKAFSDNKEKQIELKTSLETTISGLVKETSRIGKDAENLTRALKADPKKQGNWGEAVLKNILEASGMTEGVDFFTQESELDEEGNRLIPDVKVVLPPYTPGEKPGFMIIDSKVSLTDYLAYMQEDDPENKKIYLRKHIDSVKSHYKELSEKDYAGRLKDSFGYVMMFVPNEGSYLLAVENAPEITMDAYRKHVILLNPTNLMLALKLVYLIWQSQKQAMSVDKIISSANKIYEKFAGFTETYTKLEGNIKTLSETFNTSKGQLLNGKGNVIKQFEGWKDLGILPAKQISAKLLASADEESE